MAIGNVEDENRVQAGVDWLIEEEKVENVPGFEDASEESGWDEGLKFYFFLGLSRILPAFPKDVREKRSQELAEIVLDLQDPKGFWLNKSARMREDDPLIATCFSLIALSNLGRL